MNPHNSTYVDMVAFKGDRFALLLKTDLSYHHCILLSCILSSAAPSHIVLYYIALL